MKGQFPLRHTLIVHDKLADHMARVAAARRGDHGVEILTMGQLAARLAGGFFRPIDSEDLREAVRGALDETNLDELDSIKNLPGMIRAAATTLDKVWHADIELSRSEHPRLKALATLERQVLLRLPASQKRPRELVDMARGRLQHAPAIAGRIEIIGHSEMPPCWRPLLNALGQILDVQWNAGSRSVPDWLQRDKVNVVCTEASAPQLILVSCANPLHEAIEAMRWMRELLAKCIARPEQIAIVAATPGDFDDHILALSNEANLPVHFVHGIKAITTQPGQSAAALAQILVKGISQQRVHRLLMLVGDRSPATKELPPGWNRLLPKDAPLTTVERWRHALEQISPDAWPDAIDRSAIVLNILALLEKGTDAAGEAGEALLPDLARALWRRALKHGPAEALPVTLTQLRVDDGLEPATHVIWASAISLASAPRSYVRLLSLNAGRWPRRISEDRLIPDHVIPIAELDPLPVSEADEKDFKTILNCAKEVWLSHSRRDVQGRLLGGSPLIQQLEPIYLSRGRTPEHAASESDRLLARPAEFSNTPGAASGLSCWRDWYREEITPHDGLIGGIHPRIQKVLARPQSASSLRLLLRDPIRFVWKYALGWRQPEEADEPLTLDGLASGNLLHAILQKAVSLLEENGGLAGAGQNRIVEAMNQAADLVSVKWEQEQPIPPPVIWRANLERIRQLALAALTYRLDNLSGQRSWTEVPFGTADQDSHRDLPWDPETIVEIPGTGIMIFGYIDRLDLSSDNTRARVIDYKSGRQEKNMASVVVHGGKELQRCLYAFAVKTLLKREVQVQAALLYPSLQDGAQTLFALQDVEAALNRLAEAIRLAKINLEWGHALPGIDATDKFNDLGFALPGNAAYLPRKAPFAQSLLGEAARIWEDK